MHEKHTIKKTACTNGLPDDGTHDVRNMYATRIELKH
jgi:hypothetical protein